MADREDIARLLRAYEVETPVARYPEDYLDLADRILARLRSEPPTEAGEQGAEAKRRHQAARLVSTMIDSLDGRSACVITESELQILHRTLLASPSGEPTVIEDLDQWMSEDEPHCHGCGEPHWYNVWVPDDVWPKIMPDQDDPRAGGGGVLCARCIDRRCAELGMSDVPLRFHYTGRATRSGGPADRGSLDANIALQHAFELVDECMKSPNKEEALAEIQKTARLLGFIAWPSGSIHTCGEPTEAEGVIYCKLCGFDATARCVTCGEEVKPLVATPTESREGEERERCPSVSDQGLRCALETGHDGDHSALCASNRLWPRTPGGTDG